MMPNWVKTTLTVKGKDADVRQFVEGILHETSNGETIYRIFDSYYPMPPALNGTISPPQNKSDEEAQQADAMVYGAGNWYDWQRIFWGVKWGDCDTRLVEQVEGRVVFSLKTPWSQAIKAWLAISAWFPILTFHTDFIEEAGFFDGIEVYHNNVITESNINRPAIRSYWDEKDEDIPADPSGQE